MNDVDANTSGSRRTSSPVNHRRAGLGWPFLVPRQIVEGGDIQTVADVLMPLGASAHAVRANASRVQLWFDGFDADPRELYVIPEVRAFVGSLSMAFPYWLHFGSKIDESLFVILACLLPIEGTMLHGHEVKATFARGSLSSLLLRLFGAMNSLYARHGMSREENDAMTAQVTHYMAAYTR